MIRRTRKLESEAEEKRTTSRPARKVGTNSHLFSYPSRSEALKTLCFMPPAILSSVSSSSHLKSLFAQLSVWGTDLGSLFAPSSP